MTRAKLCHSHLVIFGQPLFSNWAVIIYVIIIFIASHFDIVMRLLMPEQLWTTTTGRCQRSTRLFVSCGGTPTEEMVCECSCCFGASLLLMVCKVTLFAVLTVCTDVCGLDNTNMYGELLAYTNCCMVIIWHSTLPCGIWRCLNQGWDQRPKGWFSRLGYFEFPWMLWHS